MEPRIITVGGLETTIQITVCSIQLTICFIAAFDFAIPLIAYLRIQSIFERFLNLVFQTVLTVVSRNLSGEGLSILTSINSLLIYLRHLIQSTSCSQDPVCCAHCSPGGLMRPIR